MNLYLRYFDRETLVHTVDEAIAFLSEIEEVGMNPVLEADIREYAASDVFYPKRYKVRPRVYFIIIKTEADNMQDFKDKKAVHNTAALVSASKASTPALVRLNEERPGWYEGMIDFKLQQKVRISSSAIWVCANSIFINLLNLNYYYEQSNVDWKRRTGS